jgi:hypothetical protein
MSKIRVSMARLGSNPACRPSPAIGHCAQFCAHHLTTPVATKDRESDPNIRQRSHLWPHLSSGSNTSYVAHFTCAQYLQAGGRRFEPCHVHQLIQGLSGSVETAVFE